MITARRWLPGALLALLALHHDLWWWNDASLVLGLPIGLTYHVVYCFAVTAVMALALRRRRGDPP